MTDATETLSGAVLERLRGRTVRTLVAGVALGATGHIAAATIGTIAGRNLGGSAAWAGIPNAVAVLGTAAGAVALSSISVTSGRRAALAAGFAGGVAGALAAVAGLALGSLAVFLVGVALTGLTNAAIAVARYVGGDMFPAAQRARRIGLVVWGSTAGAVIGPNLVAPSGGVAQSMGLPEEAGAYVVAALTSLAAAVLALAMLRPDPARLTPLAARIDAADAGPRAGPNPLLQPTVLTALVALVAGQVVMVMVMAMTPLHLADHGQGLGMVGIVLSAHTLGMFALGPVSGRLTDRYGSRAIILAGFGTLAGGSLLAAIAPATGGPLLVLALFLLGWGWNLGFVAASAMLAGELPLAARARLQGTVDGVVWTSSAVSSLAAGPLLGAIGYAGLGLLAACLVVVPALLVAARRASFAAQGA